MANKRQNKTNKHKILHTNLVNVGTKILNKILGATEPARLEPVPRNGRGRDSERPAHRDEERSPHCDEEWPPLAATRESPRTNRRPNTVKKIKNK